MFIPPQTYYSIVKNSFLLKLQADRAELPVVLETDPSRDKSVTVKHAKGHLDLSIGPNTAGQGGESQHSCLQKGAA